MIKSYLSIADFRTGAKMEPGLARQLLRLSPSMKRAKEAKANAAKVAALRDGIVRAVVSARLQNTPLDLPEKSE